MISSYSIQLFHKNKEGKKLIGNQKPTTEAEKLKF